MTASTATETTTISDDEFDERLYDAIFGMPEEQEDTETIVEEGRKVSQFSVYPTIDSKLWNRLFHSCIELPSYNVWLFLLNIQKSPEEQQRQ